MREVHKFDEEGFLLLGESIVIEDNEEVPEGYEDIEIPHGLFKPRKVDGVVVEGASFNLEIYKEQKINYLFSIRDQELNSSFFSTINSVSTEFSYDKLSQERFNKQASFLALDPTITTVEWKTKNDGFIVATREEFTQILRDAASHEMTIEFKYLYARANIENSTTKEQVDTIVDSW